MAANPCSDESLGFFTLFTLPVHTHTCTQVYLKYLTLAQADISSIPLGRLTRLPGRSEVVTFTRFGERKRDGRKEEKERMASSIPKTNTYVRH